MRLKGDVTLYRDQGELCYILHSAGKRSIDKVLAYAIRVAALQMAGIGLDRAEAVYYKDRKKNRQADRLDSNTLATQNHSALLENLARLFARYRDCGLPFEPVWSAILHDNQPHEDPLEDFDVGEQAESYWADNIQNDMLRRSYFVSVDAIRCDTFQAVSNQVWQAFSEWQAQGVESQ